MGMRVVGMWEGSLRTLVTSNTVLPLAPEHREGIMTYLGR